MGLLDKLDDALGAAGDAIGSRAGAVKDAVSDIVVDGAFGLVNDLFIQPWQEAGTGTHWYDAVGHGLSGALGDVGHVLGGAFHLVEAPIIGREGIKNVDEDLSALYRNVVDKPVATVFTAASLAESESYQGTTKDNFSPGRIFRGKLWSDSWKVVNDKNRTLGQAYALMGSDDITDQAAVARYQQGRLYKVTSGTLDATAPFLLDPLLPIGSAANVARARLVTKPIRAGDDLAQIAGTHRVQQVVRDMHDNQMTAAQIRHKYGYSPDLSVLLETAGTPAAKTAVLRHAMGDMSAINDLNGYSTYLTNSLNRLVGQKDALRAAGFSDEGFVPIFDHEGNLTNHDDWHASGTGHEELRKVQAEIAEVHGEQNLLARWDRIHGELDNTPRATRLNDLRYNVTRSEWYQGRKGAPLRVVFQMKQHAFVNLDDPIADVQVHRMLSHSALDNDTREALRNEYLHAVSGDQRLTVIEKAENAVVDSILRKYGHDDVSRTKVLALAADGRSQFRSAFDSRATNFDGQGRDAVTLEDGTVVHLPLSVSQNRNVAALVDTDKVETLAKRYAPAREDATHLGSRLAEMTDEAATQFYRLWKPSVLLRIAYPLRVALGEEQARMIAMFGALAQPKYLRSAIANNREDAVILRQRIDARIDAIEAERGKALSGQERVAISRTIEKDYNLNERQRGFRRLHYAGYDLPTAFGGQGKKFETLNSSRASFDRNMGRESNLLEGALAKHLNAFGGTGRFEGDVRWHDTDRIAQAKWNRDYLNATNRHLGHDAVGRKLIEQHLRPDKVADPNGEIKAWLNSKDGAWYRAELDRTRQRDLDGWLDSYRSQIESYLPTDALKQATLDKKMSLDLMDREFTTANRPVIHGEVLVAHTIKSQLGKLYDNAVDRMYRVLASGPTDVLSRHPAFNHVYARDMARQIELAHGQATRRGEEHFKITQAELDKMAERSRRKALAHVKKNLYDIAETSDLGHALRFVSPFFNAWQEVLTVWGGLSVNNFKVPVQLHNAWDAPDRLGLTYTDPATGNEYLTLPVPKFMREHFPGGALKDVDHLMMSKRGLNLIMTGLPGAGPIVGIPSALVLKDRPDLASSGIIKALYPFGPPRDLTDAIMPTTIRNLVASNADFDNSTYKRMYVSIWNKQMVDYNLGKRATAPDPAQIEAEAHKLSNLRSILQFILPSAPKFDTPYQPFLDAYQRLLAEDPEHADERFYDQYGSDYFQLTTHMSKTVNGVPPTLEAWEAQQKYASIISEHPEYGRLILGDIEGSEFNSAVYAYQQSHRVGPGDERKQRTPLMVQDIIADPQVRAGWLEYHKNMTLLEDELERRGLKDFNSTGAEDLKALKKQTVAWMLSQPQFEGWANEFGQRDDRKWIRRIDALTDIANSPTLSGRPDILGLREYLTDRKTITDELARRKAGGLPGTLDANANEDLAGLWESAYTQLTLSNPAFAALAHRYLDNDVLAAS